jgi:hypothetical protein
MEICQHIANLIYFLKGVFRYQDIHYFPFVKVSNVVHPMLHPIHSFVRRWKHGFSICRLECDVQNGRKPSCLVAWTSQQLHVHGPHLLVLETFLASRGMLQRCPCSFIFVGFLLHRIIALMPGVMLLMFYWVLFVSGSLK